MPLPPDYLERAYAGVLGKLIGVYLGRPFEGKTYAWIMANLGEIWYYVHQQRNVPLVVTDDDIGGTFTFLRALPDYANRRDLSPAQIGQTWLNYLIEQRTILWWGGMGNSTEHTAFLRLKHGITAPESGSIARNGTVVAEQIGAQIFIDGWAMVAPGDPALAADLARRAASVSHDGEAIYAAQVLAAMEAQAFTETDRQKLIDVGLSFIPKDSLIARMVNNVREWHAEYLDWHLARNQIAAHYGYDTYGGNCHVVPNHALIHLGLLYGDDDFQQSLMITNTAGWDTDCNSGNLGCLLGIKLGLAGIDAGPDWRGPVADRLYLPSADGGRAISDAVQETYQIANIGRALAGEPPLAPKGSARFHFELAGSVQGFVADQQVGANSLLTLENVAGHSAEGRRSLALRARGLAPGVVARATTATFLPPNAHEIGGYTLVASPTIYPGQTVRARIAADSANAAPLRVALLINSYGAEAALVTTYGPNALLEPGDAQLFTWRIPDLGGQPIAQIGLEICRVAEVGSGSIYLDYLTWDGAPDVAFKRPIGGNMWREAWVNAVDQYDHFWPEDYRLSQNEGTGMLITGTREWADYRFMATATPHLAEAFGIAVRVQGLRRYYALLLLPNAVRLVKSLDGEQVLAEVVFDWQLGQAYNLRLEAHAGELQAFIDDQLVLAATDGERSLTGGGVALVCAAGRVGFGAVAVRPRE